MYYDFERNTCGPVRSSEAKKRGADPCLRARLAQIGEKKMAQTNGEGGASTALKGLRLLTLDRGTEGYGFHMYTNRSLKVSLTDVILHTCTAVSH